MMVPDWTPYQCPAYVSRIEAISGVFPDPEPSSDLDDLLNHSGRAIRALQDPNPVSIVKPLIRRLND